MNNSNNDNTNTNTTESSFFSSSTGTISTTTQEDNNNNIIIIKTSIYQTITTCPGLPIHEEGNCADLKPLLNYGELLSCVPDTSKCYQYGLTETNVKHCNNNFRNDFNYGSWGWGFGYCAEWQETKVKTCISWGITKTPPAECVIMNAQLTNGTILATKNCGYLDNTKIVDKCAIQFIKNYANWTQINDYSVRNNTSTISSSSSSSTSSSTFITTSSSTGGGSILHSSATNTSPENSHSSSSTSKNNGNSKFVYNGYIFYNFIIIMLLFLI
jgi:hypothetical protein